MSFISLAWRMIGILPLLPHSLPLYPFVPRYFITPFFLPLFLLFHCPYQFPLLPPYEPLHRLCHHFHALFILFTFHFDLTPFILFSFFSLSPFVFQYPALASATLTCFTIPIPPPLPFLFTNASQLHDRRPHESVLSR